MQAFRAVISMMSLYEFCKFVEENIKGYLPEEYRDRTVHLRAVEKNNGVNLHGLSLSGTGLCIAPVLYMEEYYNDCKGDGMEKTMQKIASDYVYAAENGGSLYGEVMEWIQNPMDVRGRIIFRLISAERNAGMLEGCPHRLIGDLAVVYYILVAEEGETSAAVRITEPLLVSLFGEEASEEMLFSLAQKNTPSLLPAMVSDMMSLIKNGAGFLDSLTDVWDDAVFQSEGALILTNKKASMGAATLLYPGMTERIEENFGPFYVIPMSVHEVVLIHAVPDADIKGLQDIIKEINRTKLMEEDFLSDHVYRKSTSGGVIEVAAAEELEEAPEC